MGEEYMQYQQTKIVIVGFGHLMEYIAPCYQQFLGENLKSNLIATTADTAAFAQKQQENCFTVILNDNETALHTLQPDIILFAPPPKIAPILTKDTLVPYFKYVRENGLTVPDLYVFPPSPAGAYYLEQLGKDVNVVNILPNMTNKIANRDVAKEGYTILTFPDGKEEWPEENKKRLKAFWKPLGNTLEVSAAHTIPVLASSVTCNVFTNVIFMAEQVLRQKYSSVTYSKIASAMRSYLYPQFGLQIPDCLEYNAKAVSEECYTFLCDLLNGWMQGLLQFLKTKGLPQSVVQTFLAQRMDSFLQICQLMKKVDIDAMREKRATKGGSLAKGLDTFAEQYQIEMDRLLQQSPIDTKRLQEISYQIASVVCEHSLAMGEEKIRFGIDHHATMYALLSKDIQQICPQEGLRVMGEATTRYAKERGARMAENAKANGDPLTLESYFAYVEWTDEDNEMKRSIVAKEPVYRTGVQECGWVNSWKKRGLLEYGKVYCQFADYGLVAGFNPKNKLILHKLLSAGDDCCDFDWVDYAMTEERAKKLAENREKVGLAYRKDFIYHTAHLYQCVADEFEKQLSQKGVEAAKAALEEFSQIFSEKAAQLVLETSVY